MDEDVGVHNMKLYLSPAPTSDITVKYNISTGYAWGSATGGVGAQAHRQPADGRMGLDGLPIDGGREGLSLTTTADALLVETTSKETTGLDAGNATISASPSPWRPHPPSPCPMMPPSSPPWRWVSGRTGAACRDRLRYGHRSAILWYDPQQDMARSVTRQPNQAGTLPLPTSHHGHQCSRGYDALLQPVAMEQGAGATSTGAT